MRSDLATIHRAARLRYETGRALVALRRATAITLVAAVVSGLLFGARALAWLPVTIAVVTFTEWRGTWVMSGARRGIAAGFASMLLPLSVLRPCCGVDAKAAGALGCCTVPSVCWAAGALLGLGMALLLPRAPEGRTWEATAGMILGITSVTIVRCSILFLGEAAGLLGGMAAGVIATSLARAWLARAKAVG